MQVWSVVMVTIPAPLVVSVAVSAGLSELLAASHTLPAGQSVDLDAPVACSDRKPSARPSVGEEEQASFEPGRNRERVSEQLK